MKKKYIQLSVVAALLIGMSAMLLVLKKTPGETQPEPVSEAVYAIGSADALPPAQIDILNETGRYTIINDTSGDTGSKPYIEGWQSFSLDGYGLDGAVSSAKEMAAKQIVVESASGEDLDMFGLSFPRATVDIKGADGGVATLLIGDEAPGGEGVYVSRKGSDTVYLVMPSLVEPFTRAALDYINKAVTATDPDFKGFDRLVLSGTNYPEPVVIEKSPETQVEAAGMSFGTHRITSPVNTGVSSQPGMEQLASLYGLVAQEVVSVSGDDAAVLESFGLSEPAAAVSATSELPELTFTLRVSKTGEDGAVYLIKSGSPVIYRLDASALPWLGLTLFDYMDKMVILPNIDKVSAVTVKTAGKAYSFGLSGENDALAVTLGGKELPDSADNFRKFYQTLISASYSEEAPQQPGPEAEELLRIEYRYRDGKAPDAVTFYPGPPRRAYISLNDGTAYLCPSSYVDRVIADAARISAGEAVESYY